MDTNTQQPEEDQALYPVILDPRATTQFEAGGHIYRVEKNVELSVARDRYLERYSLQAALARSSSAIREEIRKAYDLNNQSKPGDVGVVLHNLLAATVDLETNFNPIYLICTLFINRVDEDRTSFSSELAMQKLEDWSAINRSFFFTSAVDFLTAIGDDFSRATQTFSSPAAASPAAPNGPGQSPLPPSS
ncbi:hypothetical protein GCM10023187_12380 [Nibrella viscosa]|uniref:Uncharacterized protein n=1 Tax=Nibrella viscosa TaxID=1084524 RepID=A0ABP8K3Y2_9BACT